MAKLDHYGIRDNLHSWIRNVLVTRTQQVVCEGQSSKSSKVASGVPQGTVLGPLFFLCCINDYIKSSYRLFADDCLIYRLINCIDDCVQLQKDLTSFHEWSKKWDMRFNPQKMLHHEHSRQPSYFYQMSTDEGLK